MENNTIVLAGMAKESTVDGPGVRLALFMQGCPHHCSGCHNPETWDENGGQRMSVTAALKLMAQYLTPLHQGITISGGEPFMQPDALLELLQGVRESFPALNIWCYSGYIFDDLQHSPVLPLIDILVDGPYQEELRDLDLLFRGSRNQRIIDVAASLQTGQVVEHSGYMK